MNKKSDITSLSIGIVGAFLGGYSLVLFNQNLLMSFPLAARMVLMIAAYWLIAAVPIIVMKVCKETLSDYGFYGNLVGKQVMVGIMIAIAMSLVLTVVPHMLGFRNWVDSGKRYTVWWQFVFEFVYCILAVGCVEEFVFRGFLYSKIKAICKSDFAAILGSSLLFGLFHVFVGNIAQMVMTALIGMLFCFCRKKIKNCSTLSLILAHGIYDALITVWASILH